MRFEKQNLFFTSDFHIGHNNVIRFDKRPFANLDEMHNTIIKNWNSVVNDDDIVFYLGDIAHRCHPQLLSEVLSQLKGRIHHIMGNHDRYAILSKLGRFEKIYGNETALGGATISVKDSDVRGGYQDIVMCHYAILSWNKGHYGSWHLHGHSHQSLFNNPEMEWYYKRKVIDVGCNGWDYKPLSYQEVKEIMSKKIIKPVDHHE